MPRTLRPLNVLTLLNGVHQHYVQYTHPAVLSDNWKQTDVIRTELLVNVDRADAECSSDGTRVLTTGAAEARQNVM